MNELRFCDHCNNSYVSIRVKQRYCSARCRKTLGMKEYREKVDVAEKYRESRLAYQRSEKYKEYRKSEQYRRKRKEYCSTEQYKKKLKEYRSTYEFKKRIREYRSTEEYKEKVRESKRYYYYNVFSVKRNLEFYAKPNRVRKNPMHHPWNRAESLAALDIANKPSKY